MTPKTFLICCCATSLACGELSDGSAEIHDPAAEPTSPTSTNSQTAGDQGLGTSLVTVPADKPELELLDYWRLDSNLPTGTNYLDSLNLGPTALNTYSDSYFRVVTGGGVSMRARFGGAVSSSHTAYARTELREMASATTPAAWPCKSKEKRMYVRLRIKETGRYKPEMSVAQIHDETSDNLQVLYIYEPAQNNNVFPALGGLGDKGKIIARWNSTTANDAVLDSAYVVGDVVELTITANAPGSAGIVAVDYKNATQNTPPRSAAAALGAVTGGCYFKAGNYHQSCTKQFIDGTDNQTCIKKNFSGLGFTWEPPSDAAASSELILYNLTVTPKG
jgi:Alginate lyase